MALPVLVLVTWAAMWFVSVLGLQARCTEAARAAARAGARGDDPATAARSLLPTGARLRVIRSGPWLEADVTDSRPPPGPLAGWLPGVSVRGRSVAAVEDELGGAGPDLVADAVSETRRTVRSRDRGSASIWVLSVTALVLFIGAVTMTITAAGVGRARAEAAADLAALAGAQHVSDGWACRWAREAAGRNFAVLSDCRVGLTDVTVSVAVPVRVPFWPFPAGASVRATSRAGPAGSRMRA